MTETSDITTLVGLFHTRDEATEAIRDLQTAGVPEQAIQAIGGEMNRGSAQEAALTNLGPIDLPAKDLQVLSDGLKSGGTVLIVRAEGAWAEKAERVFADHHAAEIDERTIGSQGTAAAASSTGQTVIPIVEETLTVGKRQVERGGVRVFSRVVETPVEEQVVLREEHATIERHAVNRPICQAELDALQNQNVEVRETGEEAVVGKTARVVEEVMVGKEASERTEKIRESVRNTQVDVSPLKADVKGTQHKS